MLNIDLYAQNQRSCLVSKKKNKTEKRNTHKKTQAWHLIFFFFFFKRSHWGVRSRSKRHTLKDTHTHAHTCQPSQAQYAAQGAVISINSASTSCTTLWLRLHINKHRRDQPRAPSITHVPVSSAHKHSVSERAHAHTHTPGACHMLSPSLTHTQTVTHSFWSDSWNQWGLVTSVSAGLCKTFSCFHWEDVVWFSVSADTQELLFFSPLSSSSFSRRPAGPLTRWQKQWQQHWPETACTTGSHD